MDKDGSRLTGMEADAGIYALVVKQGQDYYAEDIRIENGISIFSFISVKDSEKFADMPSKRSVAPLISNTNQKRDRRIDPAE